MMPPVISNTDTAGQENWAAACLSRGGAPANRAAGAGAALRPRPDRGVPHPRRVMPPGRERGWTSGVPERGQRAARAPQLPGGSVNGETPVLDTLADITAASIENNSLVPREFMLARMAALIAVDAPPASYLANAEVAADAGVTADDIQGIMIAVAPVVGTPRVVAASGNILRALGFAITVADSELADDDDDDEE